MQYGKFSFEWECYSGSHSVDNYSNYYTVSTCEIFAPHHSCHVDLCWNELVCSPAENALPLKKKWKKLHFCVVSPASDTYWEHTLSTDTDTSRALRRVNEKSHLQNKFVYLGWCVNTNTDVQYTGKKIHNSLVTVSSGPGASWNCLLQTTFAVASSPSSVLMKTVSQPGVMLTVEKVTNPTLWLKLLSRAQWYFQYWLNKQLASGQNLISSVNRCNLQTGYTVYPTGINMEILQPQEHPG